jgi:hypothetical protein
MADEWSTLGWTTNHGPFFLLRRVLGQGMADRDPRQYASDGRAEGLAWCLYTAGRGPPRAADRSARGLDSRRRGETRVPHVIQVMIFIEFYAYSPDAGR